jgi:large subunit ribosomal protein L25
MLIGKLNIIERVKVGSSHSKRLRREGKVPAVVYGLHKEPRYFYLEAKEFDKVLSNDVHIIALKSSAGEEINALIKDVQYNYLAGHTTHVDFQEINMNEAIVAKVAVYVYGTPAGLTQGGVLDQYIHEIEVSCLPKDLPESITVNVSKMGLGDVIHLKDIILPDRVKAVGDDALAVFHVGLPKVKVETIPSEEAAAEGAVPEGVVAEGAAPEGAADKDKGAASPGKEGGKEGKEKKKE